MRANNTAISYNFYAMKLPILVACIESVHRNQVKMALQKVLLCLQSLFEEHGSICLNQHFVLDQQVLIESLCSVNNCIDKNIDKNDLVYIFASQIHVHPNVEGINLLCIHFRILQSLTGER